MEEGGGLKHKKAILASVLTLFFLGAVAAGLLLFGKDSQSRGNDVLGDGTYLLTIDGYGVTEDEFLLFLADQKAATANHFWTEYQVQPDAAFWTSDFNGEVPLEYAKDQALQVLVRNKIQFLMAAERGILPYQDYTSMLESMDAENAQRREKLEAGETVYGLTEFSPFTYYQYLYTNLRAELEYSQRERSKPSEQALRTLYEENLEQFRLGTVYTFDVCYADGRQEQICQSDMEIGKEDTTTEDLIYNYFEVMEPGDRIQNYSFHGELADIIYQGKEHQGYQPYEEAKETLQAIYARDALSAQLQSRAESAEIKIDQPRFDAIQMP